MLHALDPDEVIVYGVALDVCVRCAVDGFLRRGRRVCLVREATRAIDPARGDRLIAEWEKQGVRVLDTEEALTAIRRRSRDAGGGR